MERARLHRRCHVVHSPAGRASHHSYGLYSSRSRRCSRPPKGWRCSQWDHIVHHAPRGWKEAHGATDPDPSPQPSSPSVPESSCRSAWARLIAKVYEIDPLVCFRCSCPMRVLAVITAPAEVNKILRHLVKIGRSPLERQRRAKRAAGASRPESRVAELTLLSRSSVLEALKRWG